MPVTVGKYFFLKSKFNNLYLDTGGLNGISESFSPGKTEVSLCSKQSLSKGPIKCSQVWYWDAITFTLRNSSYNLCLDVNDENRAVSNFLDLQSSIDHKDKIKESQIQEGTKSLLSKYSLKLRNNSLLPFHPLQGPINLKYPQQWRFNKNRETIENVVDDEKVLEVAEHDKCVGGKVHVNHRSMKACQLWTLEPIPIRYMFIVSKAIQGHVMDVLGGKSSAGAKVGLYVKKTGHSTSQLWFEDEMGNLRSKLNDKLVLCASGSSLRMEQANNTTQRWVICGNRIISNIDHRFVIGLGKKRNSCSIDQNDNFFVCSSIYQGLESQHWNFVPA